MGQTENLDIRLREHNTVGIGHLGKFTAYNKGPWVLVHKEEFATRSEALKREKQLKSFRGREFIRSSIKENIRP